MWLRGENKKVQNRTNIFSLSQILKIITPGDKILLVLILALGVISLITLNHFRQPGETVTIEVNGQALYHLDLNTSQQVTVTGSIGETTIKIDHGAARVIHSDCPEKICIKTGKIQRAGQVIVCVPNRVVVTIEGKRKNQFDVITQ